MDKRIVFELYQYCMNRGSIGYVSVLRWCRCGVGKGLGPESGMVW